MSFSEHQIDKSAIPDGAVLVTPDDASALAVAMQTNKFDLLADEPKRFGGNDQAPDPYAFLHSGLGSCTAITMRFYAKKHKLSLKDFHVVVSSRRDEARQLVIDKELIFHGDYSEEQINNLVAASKKCPMHKDLARAVEINTTVTIP